MLPQEKIQHYTLEEYLELDHASEEKLEFWDGNVFTLAGASVNHNQIQVNLISSLRSKLRGIGCRVFPSDMRVKVPEYPPYRYPDLSALCGEAEFESLGRQELLVNPSLIVEILSDSTAEFDRSYKFTYYKSIPSFTEYVLIAQDRAHVSQFVKQGENEWLMREFNRLAAKIYLSSLDCELQLTEIYEDVVFPETPPPFQQIEQISAQ
ncbi:MAG TPA: Uma2 family endonuclease [Pyrinomonadaceae bacterium]|nr:Uma2 family endonuclease [Pyrinomonadaceae bacterium]